MNEYQEIASTKEVRHLIDCIQAGVVLVNHDFRVVMMNRKAVRILGVSSESDTDGLKCYSLFCKQAAPCGDCPIATSENITGILKSYTLTRENGSTTLVKVLYERLGDYIVLTVHDVTKEVTLLKKIDMTRRKAEAKNIIFERRWQKCAEELTALTSIFNNMPDGVVSVDKAYEIVWQNKAADQLSVNKKVERCYELMGHEHPCEQCPAEAGFVEANGAKKSHLVGGRFFTELMVDSPTGSDGLLFFSDTTRQISLIEQIREQQDVLSGLVEFASRMQSSLELDGVLDYYLDQFLPLIKADTAAIIVDDVRPGNLWQTKERGLDDVTMGQLVRAYLCQTAQGGQNIQLPDDILPWAEFTQVPLVGGNGKRVGLVVIKGCSEGAARDKISLFSEPLGPYIHNQLLMRQLEEKANKDPLTGLYNRGYLDQALFYEREKFNNYQIQHAVVVADINRLKRVNDEYGHEAGDLLIKTVSEALKFSVRGTDMVARTGGDEFVILLVDSIDDDAQLYIKRLKEKVFNDKRIIVGSNEEFKVTISLGGVGTNLFPPEELMKQADCRMYSDKKVFYETEKRYR